MYRYIFMSFIFCMNLLYAGKPTKALEKVEFMNVANGGLQKKGEAKVRWWQARYKQIEKDAKENTDCNLLFIGDSITNMMFQSYDSWHGFKDSPTLPLWNSFYAKKEGVKALNFGVSGQTVQNVLWQVDNALWGELKPKLICVLIGTNNLHNKNNTAEEVAEMTDRLLKKIAKWSPKSRVFLYAILPRDDVKKSKVKAEVIEDLNARLKKLSEKYSFIKFRDLTKLFANEDGSLKMKLYDKDRLHLSRAGYEAWFKQESALIYKLLKVK